MEAWISSQDVLGADLGISKSSLRGSDVQPGLGPLTGCSIKILTPRKYLPLVSSYCAPGVLLGVPLSVSSNPLNISVQWVLTLILPKRRLGLREVSDLPQVTPLVSGRAEK